ncbi:hypothetical protein ACB098_11G028900 [Castanea mollissima]
MPSKFPPPWLTLILDSKFYENCDEHEGTLCNFFCIDCSEVFCESCKQEHDDEGHKVLQVYKASRHNALRVINIFELLDISDIHKYSFNGFKVVFLHSRNKVDKCRANATYKCQICGYELLDLSKFFSTQQRRSFKFCSLTCKVKDTMISEGDLSNEVPSLATNRSDEPCQCNPKRRRKGIPIRSPFF